MALKINEINQVKEELFDFEQFLKKKYHFFRRYYKKESDINSNFGDYYNNNSDNNFNLLGVNIPHAPKFNEYFSFDPILYSVLKNILENLLVLNIDFPIDLFFRLKLSTRSDASVALTVFSEIIEILNKNSLCISNINLYIMAQEPILKTKSINYKNLIKNNLLKIFNKNENEQEKCILKNVSVHAGTGEGVGNVGNKLCMDLHTLVNLRKNNNSKFLGYSFDRHALISENHPNYYLYKKEYNTLGGLQFTLPKKIQIKAHSDGDLLMHVLCDAIFAAIGEGDIGDFFPNDSIENKDRNSLDFVFKAIKYAKEKKNLKISKIKLKLIVSEFIFESLMSQSAEEQIFYNIVNKLQISKSQIIFKILYLDNKNYNSVGSSFAIESQAIVELS